MTEDQQLGKRANKLNTLNLRYANSILESLDLETFEKCAQNIITQENKHLIDGAYAQVLEFVREHSSKAFYQIMSELNTVEKLNKLEIAVEEAKKNPLKPRKTVPKPSDTIRAQRVKLKWEALAQLRETEAKLRQENALLMNEVTEKTERHAATKANIESIFNQYEETIQAATYIPTDAFEQMAEQFS